MAGGDQPDDPVRPAVGTAANERAATPVSRAPARVAISGQWLHAGQSVSNVTAARVTLRDCHVDRAERAVDRPRISRVHLSGLELWSTTMNGAVLEDVTIDGLRAQVRHSFVFGCELRRVILRGRIQTLVLNSALPDLERETEARYAQWHSERLSDPEWMLDISEAVGDIEIRGYPSRFLRLNPELHGVVTADAAAASDWRSIDSGRSALRVTLGQLESLGWEDATLIVDPKGKYAVDDFAYLAALRARGIAN
jgi:hypothetical protein